MNQPRSLAARAGRWSATHRKTAIWGWLAFVFLSFAIGGAVGTQVLQQDELGVGESGRAAETIQGAFPSSAEELVLIQSDTETTTDPSFRDAVADVQQRLQQVPYADEVQSPYAAGNSGQISADGHAALLCFKIAGDDTEVQDRVGPALAAVSAAQTANPGFTFGETGDASVNKQLNEAISDDFKQALFTSLPITLLILLIAFGALVAAGVPLLLALTAVLATIGLMGPDQPAQRS